MAAPNAASGQQPNVEGQRHDCAQDTTTNAGTCTQRHAARHAHARQSRSAIGHRIRRKRARQRMARLLSLRTHPAHGERVDTAPCGMAARRKVADMQMQAQISKKVATHARLSIQLEGTARKGNSAHTSLVVCLHRIDHVCQSAAALHVARAVCTRQGAGGERARLDKPNACRWCRRCVRTARICAHRVVLIEAVDRRKKFSSLPSRALVIQKRNSFF